MIFIHQNDAIRLTAFAIFLGMWAPGAEAQGFDPNFQARVEPLLAPAPEIVVKPKTERVLVKPAEEVEEELSLEEREEIAVERDIPAPPAGFTALSLAEYYDSRGIPRKRTVRRKAQYRTVREPRKTTLNFSAGSGYSYESNANTSRENPIGDDILSFDSGLTASIPVGPELDTLSIFLPLSSARYDELSTSSFDALTPGLTFVKVLNRAYSSATPQSKGPETRHDLALSFVEQSFFSPGFERQEVAFYIPSITLRGHNVDLGGGLCTAGGSEDYCHFANISIRADHTWSDIGAQENASLTLAALVGWRTPVKGLILSAEGSLQGKYYTEFTDGRQDLIYRLGSKLVWKPESNVSLDAGVMYTWQTSSVSALDWNGLTVLPRVGLVMKLR
jgi:hypothetical protein